MPFSLRQRWYATGLFFLVATGLSLLFRVRQPTWLAGWQLPYGYGLSLLVAVGPWLAAQFTRGVLRLPTDRLCLAFWGPSPVRSALFAVLPVLVLLVLGIPNHQAMPPPLVAAQVSGWWAAYILGEETGWRGFLQQVVPGNRLGKAAVVGTQWYLWHLSVVFETYSLSKELFFLAVLLVGSYLALQLAPGRRPAFCLQRAHKRADRSALFCRYRGAGVGVGRVASHLALGAARGGATGRTSPERFFTRRYRFAHNRLALVGLLLSHSPLRVGLTQRA